MLSKIYNTETPPVIVSESFNRKGNLKSVLQYRIPKEETKGHCLFQNGS